MKKRKPTYAEAVIWIAENDAPGDNQSAEDVASYISVLLTADLFGVTADYVARDVRDVRSGQGRVEFHRELVAARNKMADR